MWHIYPRFALVGLAAISTLTTTALAKPYPPNVQLEAVLELHNASQLQPRQGGCASGIACGYDGWLCCPSGSKCYTDANNQAQCDTSGAGTGQNPGAGAGTWVMHTTTWVQTVDLVTLTSVYSTWVPATATATCKDSQSPCGGKCCDSGYYCLTSSNTCALINGGSSGGIAPTVTYTGTPTATQPFSSPIPTGAAGGGLTETDAGGGLSGGAIAGIVIGVILGILLLFLLCLFCCARALFDTILAIFGIGRKRKHTHEETYIEEHHHSGGAVGGGRWYGGRPARPARVGSEKHAGGKKGLSMAAMLGGLALALGMKRKHDQRHDDKSTTITGSSAYYSDYTSSSSASSSDRRTRRTQHSSRR